MIGKKVSFPLVLRAGKEPTSFPCQIGRSSGNEVGKELCDWLTLPISFTLYSPERDAIRTRISRAGIEVSDLCDSDSVDRKDNLRDQVL